MDIIKLNREQVAAEEFKKYDPNRHDFRWNQDYTEVEIIPLRWFDHQSYIAYQGGF